MGWNLRSLRSRGKFLAIGDLGSPVSGAHVAGVLREEPVVSLEVLDAVLKLAVPGFVKLLNDFGARCFRSAVVGVDIIHKYGEALRPVAGLCWGGAPGSCACQHDPRIPEVHLCALDRIAAAVVFDEAEHIGKPVNRFSDVAINDVWQQNISRNGTVLQHPQSYNDSTTQSKRSNAWDTHYKRAPLSK